MQCSGEHRDRCGFDKVETGSAVLIRSAEDLKVSGKRPWPAEKAIPSGNDTAGRHVPGNDTCGDGGIDDKEMRKSELDGGIAMLIKETCKLLKQELLDNGYEYGFYLNGKTYKPDMTKGFDKEFFDRLQTEYCIQDPEDTMKAKVGTCNDAVVLMR